MVSSINEGSNATGMFSPFLSVFLISLTAFNGNMLNTDLSYAGACFEYGYKDNVTFSEDPPVELPTFEESYISG